MKILHTALLLFLVMVGRSQTVPPKPYGPIPSAQQLGWQELGFCAFVHFNMNTFTGNEWGTGKEDPSLFNPRQLDCEQWVRAFKDAGMKGVIITAKHHDGFCLWPSDYTEHSVKNSKWKDGKGDVLKELSAACRKYGLKFGVYLSPWDRHEPSYGDSPRYNEHFKNQLREVLNGYGDAFEVWFDGACGEGPNGKRQVYDWQGFFNVVRECQPNAVIFSDGGPDVRWVGNENGFADETNWSLLRRDEVYPGYPKYVELTTGHPNGTHWVPAECDVSIRPNWYYRASDDTSVRSLDDLIEIYFKSIGRNGSLLLNVPPDTNGLINETDITRLMDCRRTLDTMFAHDLTHGAVATATNVRGNDVMFAPSNAIDTLRDSYWATDDSVTSASLTLDLDAPIGVNCALIQEHISLGQRVESFTLDGWNGSRWIALDTGMTIGYKRILRFQTADVSKVRLNVLKSRACPTIETVSVYRIPDEFVRK